MCVCIWASRQTCRDHRTTFCCVFPLLTFTLLSVAELSSSSFLPLYTYMHIYTQRYVYIYIYAGIIIDIYINACMYSCSVFSKFLLSDNLLTISKNFLRLFYILLISYPSIYSWQQWKIKFEFLVHAFYLSFFKNCMFYFYPFIFSSI